MLFMDYDLSRLGESEFEHLTQALAIKVLGPAIQFFGDGPDGGREATFRGKVNYPYPAVDGPWNGYGLVQAKFRGRPTTTSADTTWFLGQLRSELKQWANPNTSRRKMGNLPEYLLITKAQPVFDAELVDDDPPARRGERRRRFTTWWLHSPRIPLSLKSTAHARQAAKDLAVAILASPW